MTKMWRLSPVAALLLAGISNMSVAGTATVFYYQPWKSWSTVYMHHNNGGSWTTLPGTAMTSACTGWVRQTVDLGSAASFEAVFTNGAGAWDNLGGRSGSNYVVSGGVHQVREGQLHASAGDPCDTSPRSTTVYYKSGWAPAYIHYSLNGSNSWTALPGEAMSAACNGWQKKTISLGSASGLAAAFNNGSGSWDSRNGANYQLGGTDIKVDNGHVSAGNPCPVDSEAPTAPTGLTSQDVSPTGLRLSWTAARDNVAVTAYEVLQGTTRIASVNTTSYAVTGLTADTAYRFSVRALDAAGNVSTASEVHEVRTAARDTQKPTVPTGLQQTAVTSRSVTLVWTPSRDNVEIRGYGILRDGRLIGKTRSATWTDDTVRPATVYRYTVAAGDTSGNNSAQSAPLSVTTLEADTVPPSAPGTLTGSVQGGSVRLSWGRATDNQGIGGYVITRTGDGGSRTFSTKGTGTSWSDGSVSAGATYSYSVKAKDTSGNLSLTASNSVRLTLPPAATSAFSWDNATVYFLMTDRFANADTANDRSYCRESDADCRPFNNDVTQMPSAFHGGDLKGITEKIRSNYFKNLGVNAIWITAPYEQMHGFVYGNDHKHYGYHGYYTLDWTSIDKNMGTREDLRELVDAAHAQGIRVVMDIVLNHVGYENIKDMHEYGYGKLKQGWENTAYKTSDTLNWNNDIGAYIDYTNPVWGSTFWGSSWVRMNQVAGVDQCDGTDGLRGCVGYLPDIKTDGGPVGLPPILQTKWTREGRLASEQAKLDAWFSANGKPRTPANYIIKWLTDYVRDFGIDGFRVDTAKHVELNVWKDLKAEANAARQAWLAANPTKAAQLKGDTGFWMTGEVWGHGVGRSAYFDNGFDSIINFSFQGAAGNVAGLEGTYTGLAAVNADPGSNYNLLSYISSHDKGLFDRNNLKTGLTSLLLAPGGVQLFYGDESGRPLMGGNWSGDHAWRGSMNWSSTDSALLSHAQKLGTFRNRHVAVGAGAHNKLADSPYTFSRTKGTDKVVIVIGASGSTAVSVAGVFADGSTVRDAYTGLTATVTAGKANIAAHANGVILLEAAQ